MQVYKKTLTDFLRDKQQFVVPIYQRTYSWTAKQCLKLFEDVKEISINNSDNYHFLGSVVGIKNNLDISNDVSEYTVIDGQQRLTTILLLIIALSRLNTKRSSEFKEEYLTNKFTGGNLSLKYKMILTEDDKDSLINLIENHQNSELKSNRIKENFEFFLERLAGENLEKIFDGIRRLVIVDICLDRNYDNPQLIFESLNSTGLDLSQVDLIRNFILMGLPSEKQKDLYHNYWHVMENNFGQSNYSLFFDRFMRDYLTIKNRNIPNIKNVYETFKKYFLKQGGVEKVDEIISNIFKFSKFFVKIALEKEENKKLQQCFSDLNELKVDVSYPFLLDVYNDFEEGVITEEMFLEILNLIQSYVFRRSICGIPTNSLNKTFANLYEQIDKNNYLESLRAKIILMTNYRRFPRDAEFKKELKEKDLYGMRNKNFCLKKFEHFNRKEFVDMSEYQLEHIMPQTLTDKWKEELGENWKEIHENYLHTLGNLSLTGYNQNLSNKTFSVKKEIFCQSPIRLNRNLAKFSTWNENSIKERAEMIANKMIEIWSFPEISNEVLEKYKDKKTDEKTYTIKDHPLLIDNPAKDLFELFRKRVINIDTIVREEFLKLYVAYKTDTNFVIVLPKNDKLILSLFLDSDEIYDPKSIVKINNTSGFGIGKVTVELNSESQIDDVMNLVKQSYEKNSENSSSF